MLKRGEEQDNVFTIIEKGNFFAPTQGVEPESVTQELKPAQEKVKKILKIVAIVLFTAVFIALGVEVVLRYYGILR